MVVDLLLAVCRIMARGRTEASRGGKTQTFETAPLEALYHTRPGLGRAAPVEEILIIEPPLPCSRSLGMKDLEA